MAARLPTGTVTFLFTDIQGSTRIAQEHRDAWPELQGRHHAILRSAIEAHHGFVFQVVGDAFCAAFHRPDDALCAAVRAQRDLHSERWSAAEIRVRMGIHTGLAELVGEDYRGYLALSSVQRVMSAGHGGQVLLSQSAFDLLENDLPEDAGLRDLGLHRLKDLLQPQHLYQLVVGDLPSDFPPIKFLDIRPHNLPIQLTSFVGRERELCELMELAGSARLITLVGVGGTGKTRLALQLAAELLDQFRDGAWLVELAPILDPALVPEVIAKALKVREQPGRDSMDVLQDHLQGRQLLVLLDNCEHLLDAAAAVADALLHSAPELRIMATGREALGIAGERSYPVRSLSLPLVNAPTSVISESDSVRLFLDRAAAAQPSFRLTEENAHPVAEICMRLDGIPLAIELAAARVNGLAVHELAARLGDRFRLLTGGSRTALPRHRTLQATIDWSYNLLSESERVVLRRLSVFAGGWQLAAAEDVCCGAGMAACDVLDALTRLVDKSLVIMEQGGGLARYRLLETIREYARDRFPEDDERSAIQARHCDYFVAVAEEAYTARASDGSTWLQRLELEHDNLRVALDWAAVHAPDKQLQLAGALGWFWEIRNHWAEGSQRLADALQCHTRSSLHTERARLAAGNIALAQGDSARSSSHFEAALVLAQLMESDTEAAAALRGLGESRLIDGDYVEAETFFREALALYRKLGDWLGTAWVLLETGQAYSGQEHVPAARSGYEEAYAIAQKVSDRRLLEIAAHCMADTALFGGDHRSARRYYSEALRLGAEIGDAGQNKFDIEGLAMAAACAEQPHRALRLMGAAVSIRETLGSNLTWGWWEAAKEHWLGPSRRALGEQESAAAFDSGRHMTLAQAYEYAWGNDEDDA